MPSTTGWSAVTETVFGTNPNVKALLYPNRWASSTITFSFASSASVWSTDPDTGYGPESGGEAPWAAGFGALGVAQRSAVRGALDAWAAVADIDFVGVTESAASVGDMRFAFTSAEVAPGAAAFAYLPNESAAAGDVWFIDEYMNATSTWAAGSFEYLATLHEIGHAIGLKHPFDTVPGNNTVLDAAYDTRYYTVMSYSGNPGNQTTWYDFEPTTPMLLDIAAIQQAYGANWSYNAGDTVYRFGDAEQYHMTIWDGGGNDTIQYDAGSGGIIDLREGFFGNRLGAPVHIVSPVGPGSELVYNVWIAWGTVIENARGGIGADKITGNAAANRLEGREGADAISGLAAADTISGGAGNDSLDGGTGRDSIMGGGGADQLDGSDGALDTLVGGAGNDTFLASAADLVLEDPDGGIDWLVVHEDGTLPANVENLRVDNAFASAQVDATGNAMRNLIQGNAAANELRGMGGNDTLEGGQGDDTLIGGSGIDVLRGGELNDTYIVTLGDVIEETAWSGGLDTVRSNLDWTLADGLEDLALQGALGLRGIGNGAANHITGTTGANLLSGLGGDDLLEGRGGNDTLLGGDGTDTLDGGAGSNQLRGGTGSDIYLVGSSADTIEELADQGYDEAWTSVDFTLGANLEALALRGDAGIHGTGNALDNFVWGSVAADTIDGAGGADVLHGREGNDVLTGGAGADQFWFDTALSAATNVDVVTDFTPGTDQLMLSTYVFHDIVPASPRPLGTARFYAAPGAAAAHDADDRIVYDTSSGSLYYDADGIGGVAAIRFAVLGETTHPLLAASDFVGVT